MLMRDRESQSVQQNTQAEIPVYAVASDSVTDKKYVNDGLYNTVDGDTVKLFPTELEKLKVSVSCLKAMYECLYWTKPCCGD